MFGGKSSVIDSTIVLERGGELSGVTWTGPVATMDYEINLDAMRLEGHDFFCGVTFPFDQTHCSLIVGGWGGYTTGLSNIDDEDASENGTADAIMFENSVWYHVRLRVTPERIQAWVDDRNIVDFNTHGRKIDLRIDVHVTKPLSLMTYATRAAFKSVTLTRF